MPRPFGDWRLPANLPPRNVLIGLGAGALVVVAIVAFTLRGSDEPSQATAGQPSPSRTGSASTPKASATLTTTPPDNPGNNLNAKERTRYCRAYDSLSADNPAANVDEDSGVDLAELSRTFAKLTRDYTAARDVAPIGLVPDYATVLGYLQSSEKAVRSKDVDQIKVMVTNLGTLNKYMSRIQATSQRICR